MSNGNAVTALQPSEAQAGGVSANPVIGGLLIGLAASWLFFGYEFVRSTSNTLYVDAYGAKKLPYVMALAPVGVVAALYLYGRLLSWLGPRKTLLATSLASAAAILISYAAIQAGFTPATGALYILREVYVVLLVEQYWSFLDSRLGSKLAKSLNGPICGIGSIGAIAGGYLLGTLSKRLGVECMLLYSAAALIPAALFSELAYARCGEPSRLPEEPARTKDHLGLGLFSANRMLILLLLVIIATQVISAMQDLTWNSMLKAEIPDKALRNDYSGKFFSEVNAAAFVGQFLAAPLLLRLLPLSWIHLTIPLVNIIACAFFLGAPSLAASGTAYLLFKTMDYSIFRAAKEIIYIPFTFDVRYRAKEIIDVFGYRFGKGGASLPFSILNIAGLSVAAVVFSTVAIGAACAWLALVIPLLLAYRRMGRPQIVVPERK